MSYRQRRRYVTVELTKMQYVELQASADLFMITIILINLCLKGFWDRKYAEPAEKAVRRLTRKREQKKMTNGLNEIF